MRLKYAYLEEIDFTISSYSQSLYESIERIGLSFAIKVRLKNDRYECIDGHKRLTVLKALKDKGIEKKITIIVINDGSVRSNDAWAGRNTH